jgi:CrcB protein
MERFGMYAAVAAGGALGSVARAWLGEVVAGIAGAAFPWGTLLINVSGSWLIGWFGAATVLGGPLAGLAGWRAFVMVGICGGFTTFSAFSLQTLEMLRAGETGRAGAYVGGSVLLCLLAVWAGFAMGRG